MQMQKHEYDRKNEEQRLEHDWHKKIKIAGLHVEFKGEFINISSDFEPMLKGQLDQIIRAKQQIGPFPADAMPVHSAPYRVGTDAREFNKNEIRRMLPEGAIESAQAG